MRQPLGQARQPLAAQPAQPRRRLERGQGQRLARARCRACRRRTAPWRSKSSTRVDRIALVRSSGSATMPAVFEPAEERAARRDLATPAPVAAGRQMRSPVSTGSSGTRSPSISIPRSSENQAPAVSPSIGLPVARRRRRRGGESCARSVIDQPSARSCGQALVNQPPPVGLGPLCSANGLPTAVLAGCDAAGPGCCRPSSRSRPLGRPLGLGWRGATTTRLPSARRRLWRGSSGLDGDAVIVEAEQRQIAHVARRAGPAPQPLARQGEAVGRGGQLADLLDHVGRGGGRPPSLLASSSRTNGTCAASTGGASSSAARAGARPGEGRAGRRRPPSGSTYQGEAAGRATSPAPRPCTAAAARPGRRAPSGSRPGARARAAARGPSLRLANGSARSPAPARSSRSTVSGSRPAPRDRASAAPRSSAGRSARPRAARTGPCPPRD